MVSAGLWPTWLITTDEPAFPDCHVARAHTADHHGGVWLPGALVADTLGELVALLPPGLTWEDRAPLDLPGVLEVWS